MTDDADATLRAIDGLISEGGWMQSDTGAHVQLWLHPWPDNAADTLTVIGPTMAYGERVNNVGKPVWQTVGTVVEVVAALRELPPPDAEDAPRTVLPRDGHADRAF